MATSEPKKPNFPSKPCPQCGALIHARSKSHPACGWVMAEEPKARTAGGKRGKGKKWAGTRGNRGGVGTISVEDIQAVKALVHRLGTSKLQELARVLG